MPRASTKNFSVLYSLPSNDVVSIVSEPSKSCPIKLGC